MKNKILLILMAASHLYTLGQCEDCYEDQGISTNPANPKNCEVDEEYPNKTNQMLNSFDWAKTSPPNPQPGTTFILNAIPLNPHAGWQVPNYTSAGIFYMQSPFEQGYLSKPGGSPLADFDFAWEDGWELMYMNTGYFPNGDVYHDPSQNNNPMVADVTPLQHTKVPYIILYNRYTGKLRTFFNVYAELGSFDNIKLDMGYLKEDKQGSYPSVVSGIFRHGNGYDLPLDQQTATKAFSTNFVNGNNNIHWFMADAQLGYDPCVCNYASEFRFKLQGLDSTRISLYGRSISSEVPLQGADGKPTYNNWLNMNTTDAALGSDGSGALIYKSLDGMLSDYQTEAKKYEEELADYNSLGNKAMRDLMGLAKTGLNSGVTGLVPTYILKDLSTNAVRIINQKFDKKNYENAKQWYKDANSPDEAPTWSVANSSTKPEGQQAYEQMITDAKKYSNELSKNLKSGLGAMSNSLFTSLYTEPSKPVKPTMPTATLTEMKIEGSMYDLTNVDIGKLYTPGSFKFDGTFSPTSYPIYNEPVGLFALLETPSVSVYSEISDTSILTVGPSGHGPPQGSVTTREESNAVFYAKIKNSLKYRFNHSVDFDFDRTTVYTQIQVTYNPNRQDGNAILKESGNLKVLHDLENKLVVASDWYPLDMTGETLLGIKLKNFEEAATEINDVSTLSLEKITYKIMVDMYFLSSGYGGSEKNSTQVFTYLLYDKDKSVDFIQEKGEWLNDPSSILKYRPGNVVLENEVIETTDDFVTEVVGTNIYVNAEEIELKGNISVASGYTAVLQAYWGIKSEPTTEIGNNIELAIKRDFYNFPETFEVGDTELSDYCQGTNKKYKANQVNQAKAKRTLETLREEEQEVDYSFKVYPNPSSDILNVESNIEKSTVDLLNIDGKVISSFDLEGNRASHNVSGISAGLYFVRLATPQGYKYLRFVKQ